MGLARAGKPLERHLLDTPVEHAVREFSHRRLVVAAALEEVDGVDSGLGMHEAGSPPQFEDLLRYIAGVRIVDSDSAYALVKSKINTSINGVSKTVSHQDEKSLANTMRRGENGTHRYNGRRLSRKI